MLPYSMIAGGTFTSTASTPYDLSLVSQNPPDFFVMKNITQWGNDAAKDVEFWWEKSMAQGTARGINQTVTSGALNSISLTADGVYTYDTATPPTFTINTSVTAVARGSAGGVTVVTVTNDGNVARGPKIQVGDTVRLINITAMEQVSGMLAEVVAITSTTSITLALDSAAFAADGTTGSIQKVIPSRFYPRYNLITAVSKATNAVISLTRNSDYTVGEEVSFRVPASSATPAFSTMSQLNNRKGVVKVVTPATSTTCAKITVDIDTTGFTTFALPTSAQAAVGVGPQLSMVVPAGSGVVPNQNPPGTNLLDAFDNRNTRIIHLGATMFDNTTTGDTWLWQAYKYDQYNGQ